MAVNNYKNIFINIAPQERKNNKKFCWFRKNNIKYIDYKDPDFLLRFVNEQGKMYPRRITGTSLNTKGSFLPLSSARGSLHCCLSFPIHLNNKGGTTQWISY